MRSHTRRTSVHTTNYIMTLKNNVYLKLSKKVSRVYIIILYTKQISQSSSLLTVETQRCTKVAVMLG